MVAMKSVLAGTRLSIWLVRAARGVVPGPARAWKIMVSSRMGSLVALISRLIWPPLSRPAGPMRSTRVRS